MVINKSNLCSGDTTIKGHFLLSLGCPLNGGFPVVYIIKHDKLFNNLSTNHIFTARQTVVVHVEWISLNTLQKSGKLCISQDTCYVQISAGLKWAWGDRHDRYGGEGWGVLLFLRASHKQANLSIIQVNQSTLQANQSAKFRLTAQLSHLNSL